MDIHSAKTSMRPHVDPGHTGLHLAEQTAKEGNNRNRILVFPSNLNILRPRNIGYQTAEKVKKVDCLFCIKIFRSLSMIWRKMNMKFRYLQTTNFKSTHFAWIILRRTQNIRCIYQVLVPPKKIPLFIPNVKHRPATFLHWLWMQEVNLLPLQSSHCRKKLQESSAAVLVQCKLQ